MNADDVAPVSVMVNTRSSPSSALTSSTVSVGVCAWTTAGVTTPAAAASTAGATLKQNRLARISGAADAAAPNRNRSTILVNPLM